MVLTKIYFLCYIYMMQSMFTKSLNVTWENRFSVSYNKDDTSVLIVSIIKICFNNDYVFLTHRKNDITDILRDTNSKSLRLFYVDNNEIISIYKRSRRYAILKEKHLSNQIFPLSGVVIDIEPDMNFTKTLEDMRNSIWWNSRSLFLLISRNVCEDGRILDYLKILWDFKILSAVYICQKAYNDVSIYTFNPFTNSAPTDWQEIYAIDEHWTLYKLSFQRHPINSELCNILYFDKTKEINGYRLKIRLWVTKNTLYDKEQQGYDRIKGSISNHALAYMNATFDIKITEKETMIDKNGQPQGTLKDIFAETVNLSLNWYFINSYWKHMCYPFDVGITSILTQKTPIHFETKFSLLFKWNFWLAFILACTMCVLILKHVLEETTYSIIIKFIQLAFSSIHLNEPPRSYARMLLLVIIIFTAASNSFMQTNLNWWFSLPKYESTVQTVEDIAKSNITLYALIVNRDLWPLIMDDKVVAIHNLETCLSKLYAGEKVACAVAELALKRFSWWKYPLIYKIRSSLFHRDISCVFAEDFPLSYRLSMILQKMREGGLVEYIYRNEIPSTLRDKSTLLGFETFNLEQFIVCMYILLVGWASAALVLIAEFVNEKKIHSVLSAKLIRFRQSSKFKLFQGVKPKNGKF